MRASSRLLGDQMEETLFIGGKWQAPTKPHTIPVINPSTEELIAEMAGGNAEDVGLAVQSARTAFRDWRNTTGAHRATFLRSIAREIDAQKDQLARLSSLNSGKPFVEAYIDVSDAVATYNYYATLAEQLDARQDSPVVLTAEGFKSSTRYESLGVAALIVPWNFPLVTTAWKVAPALAAGCAVVLKPSEITALVELKLGDIAQAVGLPDGVLNIITGTGDDVGRPLAEHPEIDKISFTGSNGVGEHVMRTAARGIKKVSLELGGKSAMLVFDDADLDRAVEWIIGGIFYNCGQMCSATSRLLLQDSIAPRLLNHLKDATQAIRAGDPFSEGVTMGPLTSAGQLARVMHYIQRGRDEGLTLLTGGQRVARRGYFVEPTIFSDVPTTSHLWREEIFGPVLCSRSFKSEQEAIDLANDSQYGLAAGIITADAAKAQRVAKALDAGHIWINSLQVVFPETSWGGFRRSGIGRELGPWGLESYLEVKHITQPLG